MNDLTLNCVKGFGSPELLRHTTDKDDLDTYVTLLKRTRSLSDIVDIGKSLSKENKNVLHLIAEEEDFSVYEDLLKKHHENPRFINLLTQLTLNAESPLHLICQTGNFHMLRFLIQIPDSLFDSPEKHPRYWLKEMGRIKHTQTSNNAFHCLCPRDAALENRTQLQDHAFRSQMFTMLVELYGAKEAAMLASEKNAHNHTLLDLSKASANTELTQKVTDLFATNWRQLQLVQVSYLSQ